MFNQNYIAEIEARYWASEVSQVMSETETMILGDYFEIGRSAFEVIKTALTASYRSSIPTILDLPCGHGRVMRHLRHMFPYAKIDACDLDKNGVDFCAEHFGATPIYSVEDLTKVIFPRKYSLIWVGSLFSHTSAEITEKWLAHLARYLDQHGLIVATFIGRAGPEIHKILPFISEDKWSRILADYEATGYGYADYADDENHDYISGSYGVSMSKPSRIVQMVENIPGVRLYSYTEKAWSDNQDVLVFGRPGPTEPLT